MYLSISKRILKKVRTTRNVASTLNFLPNCISSFSNLSEDLLVVLNGIPSIFFFFSDKKKTLTQECQQYLDSATLLLQSTLQNMWTGQIEIKEVLLIEEMKDTFYDLNNIIWICDRKKNLDKELFFCFLKIRNKEIEMVRRDFYILEEFQDHCQNFSGNVLMV